MSASSVLGRAAVLAITVALVGCPQEPAAPAQPEAPSMANTPKGPSGPTGDKGPFVLPKVEAECSYVLKDILTGTLGAQLVAGHDAEVRYTLTTKKTETGTLAYTLRVDHVRVEGKREAYTVKLDSSDHGNMVRVRGGADTLLLFDAVLYFAFLGRELTFYVGENGNLTKVEGAPAVREAYLAMHPPRPRDDPHQQARVAVALSDEMLARRFLPFAAVAPPTGPLGPRTEPPVRGPADWAEYPADSMRAVRVRWVKDDLVVEEKRAFAPTERESTYPPPSGFPKVALLSAQDQSTVAISPGTPCFARAARSFDVQRTWRGIVEEDEITTEQKLQGTWMVRPADAPPDVKTPPRPASKPAAHPAP